MIKEDYGSNWTLPIESGYGWSSLGDGWKVFNKEKWPKSRKLYNKYGKFDVNGTLEVLNDNVGEDSIIKTITVNDDIE